MFSCQQESDIVPSPKTITIEEENGYLVFKDIDQVKDFLQERDKYSIPDGFVTLNKRLNNLLAQYHNDGTEIEDLSSYYKLPKGSLPRSSFRFHSFGPILNTDHLVKIGNDLLKFDFDELKSANSSAIESFERQDFEILKTTSTRKYMVKPQTRDWETIDVPCGNAYLDMQELYGNIFAFMGINSEYPMQSGWTVIGVDNGGTISYTGYSTNIPVDVYPMPSSYDGEEEWPQLIGSGIAPCGNKTVTLYLDDARADWLGFINEENDHCGGYKLLGQISEVMNRCN